MKGTPADDQVDVPRVHSVPTQTSEADLNLYESVVDEVHKLGDSPSRVPSAEESQTRIPTRSAFSQDRLSPGSLQTRLLAEVERLEALQDAERNLNELAHAQVVNTMNAESSRIVQTQIL